MFINRISSKLFCAILVLIERIFVQKKFKPLVFAVLFFQLSSLQLSAQAPTLDCNSAPVLCSINELDGYSFSMTSTSHPGGPPGNLCPGVPSVVNNAYWFAFTAWCTNLTLQVTPSNCSSAPGSSSLGVQTVIYPDCGAWNNPVDCDAASSGCNTGTPRILNLTLQIGETYWFMVDGCAGSICDILIEVLSTCGEPEIEPWTNGIMGADFVCDGETINYTTDNLPSASEYHWTIDGAPAGTTTNPSNFITWNNGGVFELCVDASNDPCIPVTDPPDPFCVDITVVDTDAGMITADSPLCPNAISNVAVTGYNADPDYTNGIIITDDSGVIVFVDQVDNTTFTHDNCATFFAYSYNFYSADGSTLPTLGDNINNIDCAVDCCDLINTPIIFEDTRPPDIMPPTVPSVVCYQEFLDIYQNTIPDADWTDNCDGSGVIAGMQTGSASICGGGTITWTWEYTDLCGNTNSVSETINIDPLPPADWIGPLPDANIDILCGDPIPPAVDLSADNGIATPCNLAGGPISPTLSGNNPPTTCGDVLIRVWEFTDACGNVLPRVTQTITIFDNQDPTFDALPSPISDIQCGDPLPPQETLTASDNCGPASVFNEVDPFTPDECNGYTITYRWRAEDPCLNTVETTVSFNVLPDLTAPVFDNPPAPIADISCDTPFPPMETLTASEGCGNVNITTQMIFTEDICNGYSVTYEWTATDDCGNASTEQTTFNVLPDTDSPSFDNAPNPVGPLTCDATIPSQQTLNASDNCSMVMISTSEINPGPDICNGYMITREWVVTDDCGNSDNTSIDITILPDTEPPVLTPPADEVVDCDNIPPVGTATATDNCSSNITINFLGENVNMNGNCISDITRTWEAIDECGNNSGPQSQVITVQDRFGPTFINPPGNEVFTCGSSVPGIRDLEYDDNCSPSGIAVGVQQGDPIALECNGGTITRTWTATDECGIASTHTQTITIQPKPDVVWIGTLPQNEVITCSETEPSPPDLQYSNSAGDPNCLEEGTVSPNPPVGDLLVCGDVKSYTWEYTTDCGDLLTYTWTITLEDITPPTWVNPPPSSITITCPDELPAVQDLEWNDDCDGTGTVPFTQNGTLDVCTGGSITREWEYTDQCGNGPITFVQNIILPAPPVVACDDGDPCTENDMGQLNCEGTFCNCVGTIKPEIEISGSTTFCIDGTTILDAGPGASYSWSSGESSQTIVVAFEGAYAVTVTDIDGCDRSSSVFVMEATELMPVIIGDTEKCFYDFVDLDAGSGFTTYSWSNGPSSQTQTGLDIGIYEVTVSDLNGCTGTSSVEVVNHPILNLEITGPSEFCQFEFTDLTATPGFANYSWSNGLSDQVISVNTEGFYQVTATDDFGCEYTADFTLTEIDLPIVNISGTTFFCEGGDSELSATPGFSDYLWSTGSTDEITFVNEPGELSVIVTDANGCTNSAAVLIEEFPSPEPSITGSLAICLGNSTTLSTQDYFFYAWSNSSNDQSITIDQPGFYSVYVETIYGCFGEAEVEVIASTSLLPNISGDTILCQGETTTLDAGVFLNYEWNDPDMSTTQTITVDQGGIYTVTVSDGGGCTGETSIQVYSAADDSLVINGIPFFCNGESTLLTADSIYTNYNWSTGSNNDSLMVDEAGIYQLTVTTENGCTLNTSIEVLEGEIPDIEILGANDFCIGDSVTLNVIDSFFSYNWSTGDSLPQITTDTAGIFSLVVTDSVGCEANTSVVVNVFNDPAPIIGGSLSFCLGASTVLDGGVNYDAWEWSTGETTQTIIVDQEQTIELTVTDLNGCTGMSAVTVTEETSLMPAITGDLNICSGESGILDGGSSFSAWEWSTGETTQIITIDSPGTYLLTVTDLTGSCTGEGSVVVLENTADIPQILGDSILCPGENTNLTIAQVFSEYNWSNGETTNTISTDLAGTYTVTITDQNGCTNVASINVTIDQIPDLIVDSPECSDERDSYSVMFSTNADSIANSLGLVTLDLTNGQYLIENIDTLNSIEIFAYSTAECENSFTVSPPNCNCDVIVDPGADQILNCNINLVTLGTTNSSIGTDFSYEWTNENGDIVGNDITYDAITPGVYTLTIFNDILLCSLSSDVTVTENIIEQVILDGPEGLCPTSNSTIISSGSYELYEWSDGSSMPTLDITDGGTFELTVTDDDGCTSSSAITVISFMDPDLNFDRICAQDKSTYTINVATSADSIEADNGQILALNNGFEISLIDTSLSVMITVFNTTTGCNSSLIVSPPNCACEISADAGLDQSIDCNNTSFTLGGPNTSMDPNLTYEWQDGNGNVLGNNPNLDITEAGNYTLIVYDPVLDCEVEDLVVIDEIPAPIVLITGEDAFCVDESSTLNATAGFESYIWSTNETENEITVTSEGLYAVTVTDQIGCTATSSFDVVAIDLPSYTFEVECEDDKAFYTVTIKTDADMLISNLGSIDDLSDCFLVSSIDTLFDFEFTIVDSNTGCMLTDLISRPNCGCTAIADAGEDDYINCSKTSAELGGTTTTIGSDYEYSWTDENGNIVSTSPTFTAISAGTYTLEVTDLINDCTFEDIAMVEDLSNEPIALILADPANIIDCQIESVTLSAEDVPDATYTWVNQDDVFTGQSIVVEIGGDFNLIVLDTITGCSNMDSITVLDQEEYPAISIDPPLTLDCNVIEIELSALSSQTGNGILHEWLDSNLTVIPNQNDLSLLVDEPGWYYFQSVDPANGCENIDSVLVLANISFPDFNFGEDLVLPCDRRPLTILANFLGEIRDYEFNWVSNNNIGFNVISELRIEVDEPGWYYLEVTSRDNGCSGLDSIFVDINTDFPLLDQNAIVDPLCAGSNDASISIESVIGGAGPFTYQLGNQENSTGLFENLSGGDYNIMITDALGCSSDTTITIIDPEVVFVELDSNLIQLELGDSSQIFVQTNIAPGDIDTIIWSPDTNLSCTNCLDPFILGIESGFYEVTIISKNGCEDQARLRVDVDKQARVYIGNAFSPNGDDNNDIVFVQSDIKIQRVFDFEIYDRWGELVFAAYDFPPNDPQYGWDGIFRDQPAAQGVYVYKVRYETLAGDTDIIAGDITLLR